MQKTKYYREAKDRRPAQPCKRVPFSLDRIDDEGRFARFKQAFLRNNIQRLYALGRAFKPVFSLGGLVHVTSEADVRAVLSNPDDFPVPFTDEMRELGDGATFLLGLDGEGHSRQHAALTRAILPTDAQMMREMSAEFAAALLDNHHGEIDAINDLIKRVPAEICIRYFGLDCDDADALADWTLAISALLFADPFGEPAVRELAFQARDKLAAHIDGAVQRIRRYRLSPDDTVEDADTLIHRLLIIQRDDPSITDKDIGAIAMGMASGFVPTNTVAASNMLTVLLDRKEAFEAVTRAARDDDSDLMRRVILEAGRLNPTLAPGQFRLCPDGAVLSRKGGEVRIKPQSTLLVSTVSAMRDGSVWRNAGSFRLDRTDEDGSLLEPDLQFGFGPHVCIGKEMAIAQISALFTELFKRPCLRRAGGSAGKLTFLKHFPRHLTLTYDAVSATQSMYLVIAPVTDGSTREQLEKELEAWGHPANPEIRAALDASGIMHFTSLAPIETEHGLNLIFELNCDGSIDSSLAAFCEAIEPQLTDILSHTAYKSGGDVPAFMRKHVVELHGKPWGATGLAYNGLSEFPVSKVQRDARYSDFTARVVRDFVATQSDRGNHAMQPLRHLRRILRGDPALQGAATPQQAALIEEAQREGYDAYHLATDAMRLSLATFEDPGSNMQATLNFLRSRDGFVITIPTVIIWALTSVAAWFGILGSPLQKAFLAPLLGLVLTAICLGILFGLALVWVRAIEKRDKPFEKRASLDKMREILHSEDQPGFMQNQVFATANLKPGISRQLFHTFGLWGNKMSIKYRFRPGLINGMGSIHYARWYKIPGSRRAVFYSNFDGSWESYLEDFIARVSWGQSSTWSNWEGFPETRYLFFKGAQDSDQFKNYARSVMRVSPFWYSRFPELTSDQIRRNGQIHTGAGLARTSTEAEEWLRLFASRPRHENLVEEDEVQALVFRGMKRLPYSVCLALRLPSEARALGEWLSWVRGSPMPIEGFVAAGEDAIAQAQIDVLMDQNVLNRVPRPRGQPDAYALAHAMVIAFGDRPLMGKTAQQPGKASDAMAHAAFIGFSAAGLDKFVGATPDAEDIAEGMSYAYRMGMGGRGEILGDAKPDQRDWYWDDDTLAGEPTEATLMLYASTPEDLEQMVAIHKALLTNHGGKVQTQIDCAPAWSDSDRVDFEHFGFRDGVSQPAMRGVGRSTRGLPERDIVEPGEFIIGYKNNSGYFPMSPKVCAEADVSGALPVVVDDNLSDVPDFGDESLVDAQRDLGRNGTYLVLRELKQDVEGFHAFAEEAAEKLNEGAYSDLYKVVGQKPDADWIKAKMMGRWQDGRPLIGNPVNKNPEPSRDPRERENDFSFGDDDPQGLACPYASHIRRTNPRESKRPGDENEQTVSNRHRLLRRGRPYVRKETGEKGLLFACVGTDIERQFEFVQQLWSNNSAFHGLSDEPDPIIGSDTTDSRTGEVRSRGFSIPTNAGPVRIEGLQSFVETKGGGYFFMPSRSALAWLTEAALFRASSGTNATEAEEDSP